MSDHCVEHSHAGRRRTAFAIALAALALPLLAVVPASASTPEPVLDGLSQSSAAASCWEIKQNVPDSPDGSYWLLTPQLVAPRTFHCDMTTDGGGWVLIGRGRNGWKDNYNGQGTSDDVARTVTGTGAFSVRQLDAHVIDGLLGGRRIDSMSDGVRLRRATNIAGTQYQEARMKFTSRDRWSWTLGAGFPISGTFDGSAFSNTTTRDFGLDNAYRRVITYDDKSANYVRGFNYGTGATGNTSADSYLYSSVAGGAKPSPFSQVFIRPKLLTSDVTYPAVPDTGTAAKAQAPLPASGSIPATWGVAGTGAAGTGENATEVQAFAQIGNVMYVGGNFTSVQKGSAATGADKVAQPYLAAFDASTGDYLSSFKPPALNNQVKALAALPGGKLAVGGEFTTVGGANRPGLVVLDGATGAVDTAWSATIVNKMTGGRPSIRALDVAGKYLYVGGAMTHVAVGAKETYAKGAGRIDISTRTPDAAWNPEFNGTVTALDVADDGSRVYYSGYFTQAKGVEALRGAAFSTSTGAPRITPTWTPTFSTGGSARYQQAVKEIGSRVWLGGSQHSMFGYDRNTFALNKAHITKFGGDVQAIEGGNGLAFQGNHSEHYNYSDTTNYDATSPGQTNPAWSQADKIYYIGAYDAGSGDYVADFTPEMRARNGMGVWAIKVATDGTVWAGGSLTNGVSTQGKNQWIGGFARFATRPHTAPGAPTDPSAALEGTSTTVSWKASSTARVTYEVLRGDRVVATTKDTSVVLPRSTTADRLFVRAADDTGNRSRSTSVFSPAATATRTAFVAQGSMWSYLFSKDTAVPATWTTSSAGTEGWKSGAAPLGFGTGPITTDIDVPAGQQRGLTSYFQRSFSVDDPASYNALTLTTRADDGVVVHVNGVEVARARMPAGPVTSGTYATSAVSTASAVNDPVVLDIPTSVLVAGENVVAVEVHSNYRSTPSSSMDLSLVGTS